MILVHRDNFSIAPAIVIPSAARDLLFAVMRAARRLQEILLPTF